MLITVAVFAASDAVPPPETSLELRLVEIREKDARLQAFIEKEQLDGVLIGTQRNVAWLTAGGDSHVVFNGEDGSALLLWTPRSRHVILANNEAPRLLEEELAGLGYQPEVFSWHGDLANGERAAVIRRLVAEKRIGSDLPLAGCIEMGAKIAALRQQLTEPELLRYRWLARTVAASIEAVCREVTVGTTEQDAQAAVGKKLLAHDILPTVLLVAADDRIARYKHPITKSQPVRRELMVSVCARKWGLVVALTRHVHFGALPAAMQERQEALGIVFASMLSATRAGVEAGTVVDAARKAYAASGFAEAWHGHHLGGAIGYKEREYKAFSGGKQLMLDRQAFAWNPTLPGVKAEDTVVLNGDGLELLSDTGDWPRRRIQAGSRTVLVPQILIRTGTEQ